MAVTYSIRHIQKPHVATRVIAEWTYACVWIMNFALFFCRDLDLDPLTFIWELDQYPLQISTRPRINLRECFRKLSHYILMTYMPPKTLPRQYAGARQSKREICDALQLETPTLRQSFCALITRSIMHQPIISTIPRTIIPNSTQSGNVRLSYRWWLSNFSMKGIFRQSMIILRMRRNCYIVFLRLLEKFWHRHSATPISQKRVIIRSFLTVQNYRSKIC